MSQVPAEGRESISGLFSRLGDEFIALVRSELRLAGGEVRANVMGAVGGIAMVAVGVMFMSVALICLLAGAVVAIAEATGLLAATLIVGAIAIILGGVAIYVGIAKLRATDLAPTRAAVSLKRDIDTLKGD